MSFKNKDLIEISFEEFDETSPKKFLMKKTHISELFDDLNTTPQKLPGSVQEFLIRSDQIEEDIRRHGASLEMSYLKKMNTKLKEMGFSISITSQTTVEGLAKVLEEVTNELISMRTQAKNLEKQIKILKEKERVSERNQRNADIFETFDYESGENLEDLFKEIMNKSFNSCYEDDSNVFTFIRYVETQRTRALKKIEEITAEKEQILACLNELNNKNKELGNKLKKGAGQGNEKLRVLEQVCLDLAVKDVKELPDVIFKFQQVMFALPKVEKFVSEVSQEFLGENGCKDLDEIVPQIKIMKKQVEESEEFKKRVFLAFGSEKLKDIVNYGRGISHFCKLFELRSSERMLGTIEELFYFVRQIKGFVAFFRKKFGMNENTQVKEVLEAIITSFEMKVCNN